ncbi:hypothetical protein OG216_46320 (plasmid) [Streptomycetaceae bacterium NBC_01309]
MSSPPMVGIEEPSSGVSGGGEGVSLTKSEEQEREAVESELASAAALHPPRWWADAKPEPAAQPAAPGPGGASSGDDPLGVADPQTSFGWAFDRDDEPRVRPPRRFNRLLVVGVLVLVVALVMLATNLRDRARSGGAENPGATSGPTAPLAEYVPRGLTLMVFEDRVQIAWQPPEHFGEVLGYMVVVQARDGTVIERVLLPGRETTASFRSPPMPSDGCFVVAALIRAAQGLEPMRTEPVCR